jgi:putative membrane protein
MEEEPMRSTLLLAGLLAAALSTPAPAQTGSTMASGTAPVADTSFVKKAAISDMYEIQASQLAQTKATSADVKSFAGRMIADHTKTSTQLKAILASKSGLTAPKTMDAEHRALLSRLRAASGATFDRLYTQQQLEAHQQAVMLFTSESQSGKDSDLKNFAGQTLPTLQQHLSMAQQLQKGGAAP